MAFERDEIRQMIDLASNAHFHVLVGALCVAGLDVVTEMTAEMLQDEDYVRQEGIPNLAKLASMAHDQVVVVFPDMVMDSGELGYEPAKGENESSFEYLIRCFMNQLLKQRPDLAKLEFQPR